MLVRFEYANGANPYIATSNKKMFEMFCNYYTTQFNSNCFVVNGLRQWNGKRTRQGYKEWVYNSAIEQIRGVFYGNIRSAKGGYTALCSKEL